MSYGRRFGYPISNLQFGNNNIVPTAGHKITLSVDFGGTINNDYDYCIEWSRFITILQSEIIGGSGTLTGASNGLSAVGTIVELGGTLTHNTQINGGGFDLSLGTAGNLLGDFSTFNINTDIRAINSWYLGLNVFNNGYVLGNTTQSVIGYETATTLSTISLEQLSGIITGNDPLFRGLEYGADYSANNIGNPRWLIDQGFLTTQLGNYIPLSEKGAANGVATLDAFGKLPTSQLTVSAMEFLGTWDASTNTPVLTAGVGNSGDVYIVSVAGTQDLGEGTINYTIGDLVIYNDVLSIWQRVDGSAISLQNLQSVTTVGNTTTNDMIVSLGGATSTIQPTGITVNNVTTASATLAPNALTLTANSPNNVILRENAVGIDGTYDVYFRRLSGTVALLSDITGAITGSILQDGNSFGSGVVIGSNDNFPVNIETNNIIKFQVETDGTLNVQTANYETLVTNNNDIPNKKYVDDALLALTGNHGRVFYVSKNGNNATAGIGNPNKPFLTIQAAVTLMTTDEDTCVVFPGTYTENITLSATAIQRHFIFINTTLSGTFTNTILNGNNFGTITGIGTSTITGLASVVGSSTWEKVSNITFNILPDLATVYENCKINTSVSGVIKGTYTNCQITSSATDLLTLYGGEATIVFNNTIINCNNFTPFVGGLSSGGGTLIFNSSRVNCNNFIATRGAAQNIQINNSIIKSNGGSYFFDSDTFTPYLVQVFNSVFTSNCTQIDNVTLDSNSVFTVTSNKNVVGTYLFTNINLVPALILI